MIKKEKRKSLLSVLLLAGALVLTGCGEEPYELQDNEREIIVNYAAKRSGKLAEFSFNSMNMFCNKTNNIHLFIGFFSDEIFP